MLKRLYFGFLAVLFLGLASIFMLKIDSSRENSILVHGVITKIAEGSTYDIMFKIEDDPNIYYINRGLELGLDIQELKQDLLDQEVKLWYADSWVNSPRHITHLETQQVHYTEW
ncbi:MAG: hypothetical protein AAFW89_01305 [Bacteroidota bacterium]